MTRTLMMKLDKIQPSQLFISSEKLSEVMKTFNAGNPAAIEPIPIKRLGNEIIFVDGHTRAFAAFLHSFSDVPVYWENEELDWDAYEICVDWCKREGIRTIADLKNRVVYQKDYEVLWYERCEKMQQDLARRKRMRAKEEFKTTQEMFFLVYSSRPLAQSSFLSMSLTADLIAALLLGYMLARTSSSNPSK